MTLCVLLCAFALYHGEHDSALVLAVLAVAYAAKRPGWVARMWDEKMDAAERDENGVSLFEGRRED